MEMDTDMEIMDGDILDSPATNILEIIKILAEEEDMKVTAFGTKKGLSILVAFVLIGVALVQPLAWGLATGLIIGSILVTFVCWEQKSVVEVIVNMPPEKQMELIQKILNTGIELSKLTPTSWLLRAPVPQSTDSKEKLDEPEKEPNDDHMVTLPNGKVATKEKILLALRDCLGKDMGMSVY
ncbi:hypothetical protein JTE90_023118 [Oedothorax gibbosus]|uniref:Uncharacterized protein n=1 Tax=Oedothorax gibbosus TaxID=931172 RepID=A0AAV6UML5_9ARAC|nr:hypothetical protein JTE90_023118 [Oedothorax gibbosus]